MASSRTRFQPRRYLLGFLALLVALYALVFATGDHSPTPKLGIDLQGGTTVTLTARTENGAPPSPDELNQARQIIEQRVNGLGVNQAQVVQNGDNLVITVPGPAGEQARSLGQTAKLYFRPVLQGPVAATAPSQGTGGATGSQGAGGGAPGKAPAGQSGPQLAPPANLPAAGPTPPPPPPPPPGGGTSGDPNQARAIAALKATRQSSDPAVQAQALAALRCGAEDPLRGYDDPARPLVACSQDGHSKYVLGPSFLAGTGVSSASATNNSQSGGWIVNVNFNSDASGIWGRYTAANVGKSVSFTLDSQSVSAPVIEQPSSANTTIQGRFSQAQAQDLANVLKYGSLPLAFDTSSAQTISPTLGLVSLETALIAGLIGLALVFVYSLFYYRALGVLTVLSLVVSGVLVYAVVVLLGRAVGFTLDLSGIAGLIVSIGITADSFVVFFERIKDEIREGRTFRSAVPRAWTRARRTVLAGDTVSLLAAVVIYILATGDVKGFAFTLGVSTVLDLVVLFLVTHPLLSLASNARLFTNPAWSGVGTPQRRPNPRTTRPRSATGTASAARARRR